jgi:CheY-like chemotaxis protein
VRVVRTGRQAIEYLRRQGDFAQAPPAQLVLLDVNLPDMLGWDLLAELRQDEALSRIPVIVLTGTIQATDAKLARQLNVARYLCKPFDADEFEKMIAELEAVVRERGQAGRT